jgi:hypothetical protein
MIWLQLLKFLGVNYQLNISILNFFKWLILSTKPWQYIYNLFKMQSLK